MEFCTEFAGTATDAADASYSADQNGCPPVTAAPGFNLRGRLFSNVCAAAITRFTLGALLLYLMSHL